MKLAALKPLPQDNNPKTLLLMLKGKNAVIEPPTGYGFIADESNRLLRAERGAYLLENKEE